MDNFGSGFVKIARVKSGVKNGPSLRIVLGSLTCTAFDAHAEESDFVPGEFRLSAVSESWPCLPAIPLADGKNTANIVVVNKEQFRR